MSIITYCGQGMIKSSYILVELDDILLKGAEELFSFLNQTLSN